MADYYGNPAENERNTLAPSRSLPPERGIRRFMNTVTELVFPVSKEHVERQKIHILRYGYEYVSSLPLQMMLYLHAFYFPLWIILMAISLYLKWKYVQAIIRVINVVIVGGYVIIQPIRLYWGFTGNLREQIPELAGCWLLTLVLQTPAAIFLLVFPLFNPTPIDRAILIIECLFDIAELVLGYLAVQTMNTYQQARFHLKQFHDLEREQEIAEAEGAGPSNKEFVNDYDPGVDDEARARYGIAPAEPDDPNAPGASLRSRPTGVTNQAFGAIGEGQPIPLPGDSRTGSRRASFSNASPRKPLLGESRKFA